MTQLSEQQILEYADKYSKRYVAKYGESVMLDSGDAFSVAYIALRENDTYDESRSINEIESLIWKRVSGALTRFYQKANGVRRKHRARFEPIENYELEISKKNRGLGDMSIVEAVEISIERLGGKKAAIVREILNGGNKTETARMNNVSCGRVTQIFNEFKTIVSQVLERK